MAEATRPPENPQHPDLPHEITFCEILVRLPPKSLLRCRAVCHYWRHHTSTPDFLLAHHARQPTLPLLRDCTSDSVDIKLLDNRTGRAAAGHRLQSISRFGPNYFHVEASCDGLLVLSINFQRFCICNPATRQYAPLRMLNLFNLRGMYLHRPTGEYRLVMNDYLSSAAAAAVYAYHVYTIGSRQRPRRIGNIGIPGDRRISTSVLFNGNLHWYTGEMLVAFNTTAELFRHMHSPIVSGNPSLFESNGVLGVYTINDGATAMDIWLIQDYGCELWAFKHRVQFPVAELTLQFGVFCNGSVVVPSGDGNMIVLVRFGDTLLQVDINGRLVANFPGKSLGPTQFPFKQTLVSHAFFPALEGYVINATPFI